MYTCSLLIFKIVSCFPLAPNWPYFMFFIFVSFQATLWRTSTELRFGDRRVFTRSLKDETIWTSPWSERIKSSISSSFQNPVNKYKNFSRLTTIITTLYRNTTRKRLYDNYLFLSGTYLLVYLILGWSHKCIRPHSSWCFHPWADQLYCQKTRRS